MNASLTPFLSSLPACQLASLLECHASTGCQDLTPLALIHDALSYYYDHKKDMEDEIALMQDESLWQKKFPGKESAASGN